MKITVEHAGMTMVSEHYVGEHVRAVDVAAFVDSLTAFVRSSEHLVLPRKLVPVLRT